MGLGVSAASAILFISFTIIFGVVFGAMGSYEGSITDAQRIEMARLQDAKNTRIEIASVDGINGTITVSNSGSTVLNPNDVDVLINGTIASIDNSGVVGHPSSSIWAPGESAVFHVSSNLSDARLKMVTENGASAYW